MRNKYLILTFVIVVAIVFISMYFVINPPKNNIKLKYIKECIESRVCYELSGELYFGNNEKEIHNGYYDFKIINTEVGMTFLINKLWYKNFNEKLYEEEYVKNICEYISKNILIQANIQLDQEDMSAIYQNIIDGYTKAKENIQFRFENVINNIKFTFYTANSELVLNMEVI